MASIQQEKESLEQEIIQNTYCLTTITPENIAQHKDILLALASQRTYTQIADTEASQMF